MHRILAGRKALITGASRGLGFEIAKKYVLSGADVMLCARDPSSLAIAHSEIQSVALPGQIVSSFAADVSIEEDVNKLVNQTLLSLGTCHILVNNAGIYGPKAKLENVDWADWIKAIQTNLIGPVLLCKQLIPHFKSNSYGKVIQLSGGGATQPLPHLSAYASSKAAIVRFAETLAEEVRGTGIDVNSIAPGPLNTRKLDEILQAGPEQVGEAYYQKALEQQSSGGASPEKGSDLVVFLGSPLSDGITGKLISALWDDWRCWPEHLSDLSGSDIYTLRRITGRDRGHTWGDV